MTELTDCLAKNYFKRTRILEETIESAWARVRGSLLHYAGRSFGWSELRLKTTFRLGECFVTIVGYADAYDPETATLYDLKTTRFVTWQSEKGFIPRGNHVVQIQCYSTLLEHYGITINRLVLVYVDDRTILAKQVPQDNRSEWMIRRATALHRAFQTSEIPKPEVGPACAYCPFIKVCPRNSEAMVFRESKARRFLQQANTEEII